MGVLKLSILYSSDDVCLIQTSASGIEGNRRLMGAAKFLSIFIDSLRRKTESLVPSCPRQTGRTGLQGMEAGMLCRCAEDASHGWGYFCNMLAVKTSSTIQVLVNLWVCFCIFEAMQLFKCYPVILNYFRFGFKMLEPNSDGTSYVKKTQGWIRLQTPHSKQGPPQVPPQKYPMPPWAHPALPLL